MLAYAWADAAGTHKGSDLFAPRPYKSYDLQPVTLTQSVKNLGQTYEITVTTDTLALFTALESDQPGRFSQNAFTLFPGCPATVIFTPKTPGATPQFTLRDLHSATT